MDVTSDKLSANNNSLASRWRAFSSGVPLLGWLLGALVAVLLEQIIGTPLARGMWLPKVPVLFGCVIMLKKPFLIPSAVAYMLLIYVLPIGVIARLSAVAMNRLAAKLLNTKIIVSVLVHILLLYAILHIWSGMSDYRLLVLKLMLVAVMLTLSLNVINGYMGEFSCSHPGFMALGAYASSAFTVLFFTNDRLFGEALLPPVIGPFFFPIALILGGLVAALGALAVAIPSFRTRGDYLAIISLAFMFIVKSLIENMEVVGGPRGLGQQPDWANLRRTKMLAFLFGAFWAGVAGGLFAHVLRYVNPGTFGLQKLAEVLAMVYFGGLNSIYGSIVGACGISLLGEALRPLELYKWIIIPLLLILVMIFRPTGLIAFKELDVKKLIQPKTKSG
jgi:branched-chain amino acid transport system permease protein